MHFSDFLKHNLADNSSYTFYEEESPIGVSRFEKRMKQTIDKYGSYVGENKKNKPVKIYNFLSSFSNELNRKLSDKNFIKENLLLFGREYEHNTSDSFFTFDEYNRNLITGNLVGSASGYNDDGYYYNISISSRFGDNFLKHLIASSDGFLELPDSGDSSQEGLAEWLLIFLWKTKLKHAYRLGLPKQYVSKTQKTVSFRGTLNINDGVRNPMFIPPYDCSFREHSYDNSITRLISNTFRLIRSKELVQDCHKLRQDFNTATEGKRVSINELMVYDEVKNPYYKDYNTVANLSRRIIKKEMADFSSNKNDLSAFFFDVSMLFEHFIRKILIRRGLMLEEKNKEQYSIPSGGFNNSGQWRLYPDVVINHEDGSVDVFDVKYKRFNFQYGVERDDLFQINTYVANILNNKKVNKCGFIFPIEEDKIELVNNPIIQELSVAGKQIKFEVHFFIVPKDTNEDYSKLFQKNITNFYNN